MNSPEVIYVAHPEATAESSRSALSNVYRFVLDCRAKKGVAPKSHPDDARKDQDAGT
jgi:hypothetical protein